MLIVEGMDNSGKTTLITQLAKDFDLKVVKSPTPRDMNFEDAQAWVMEQINKADYFTVYDRFHPISEIVYGPIVRNSYLYTVDYWIKVMGLLRRTQTTIIYCRPPRENILDFGEREQMDGVISRATRLLDTYDNIMSSAIHPLFGSHFAIHDYTQPSAYRALIESYTDYFKGACSG